jgi:hypothetical protein
MNEQESVGRTLYDLIGGFFRRDLAYILGGGLFIFVADLFWSPEIPEFSLSDYYPFAWTADSSWLATAVWILGAYVLGILLNEAADALGVINKGMTLPRPYRDLDQIDFYSAHQGKREALKIHERSVGFLHLMSAAGVSLLFGLITVAVFCDLEHPGVWLGAVLAAGGLALRLLFRQKFSFQYQQEREVLGQVTREFKGEAFFYSFAGDLLLVAGAAVMSVNLWVFRPLVFTVVFSAALGCLQMSRVFSNRVIREREAIARQPLAPRGDAAEKREPGKRPAR